MSHLTAPIATSPVSTTSSTPKRNQLPCLGFKREQSGHQCVNQPLYERESFPISGRRKFLFGLAGAGISSSCIGDQRANAAKKRPPPPPPAEKKDPNVSGVQAKVLASIKRKEAMKEAISKLRERGKPVDQPPSQK
ncbi:hypothetical protein QJS04_geneDACA010852 [Acorus gramineus]|uniref:Uncharacterized protein n=1 Tax=Acorus gramineus TaxID=55184 RepID=A0AAV9B9I6_ACOGR|nr:hypothetical protein QJS04_geneDACA010852 [Acorus gramineus]